MGNPLDATLQADDDVVVDPSFEDESVRTASLASSIRNYKYENGRRYHAFHEGAYVLPNDETEQDRLDLLHHIYRLVLGGSLHKAPITLQPNKSRVLDFGTGTGIWAIDFGDEYPNATVVGTDLSPIQPTWVPPNVKFYIDDFENDWVFGPDESFDYIHGRMIAGSVQDFPALYEKIYNHLKPGGWLEMQEFDPVFRSDDGTIDQADVMLQWQSLINEAAARFGKKLRIVQEQKDFIQQAGFTNVHEDIHKVQLSTLFFRLCLLTFALGSNWQLAQRSKAKGSWKVSTRTNVQ